MNLFPEMSESLNGVNYRQCESLLYSVKNVRVSTFWSPSSFYIQLLEEDVSYNDLEIEMLKYYNGLTIYSYCRKLSGKTCETPTRTKLKIEHLIVSINSLQFPLD